MKTVTLDYVEHQRLLEVEKERDQMKTDRKIEVLVREFSTSRFGSYDLKRLNIEVKVGEEVETIIPKVQETIEKFADKRVATSAEMCQGWLKLQQEILTKISKLEAQEFENWKKVQKVPRWLRKILGIKGH